MRNSDYGKILAKLFEELNSYWLNKIPDVFPSTTEESLAELYLPMDAHTTLSFFALPEKLLSFYQTHIFPLFWGHGLTPVTSADMLSYGNSTIPITATLIRRSSIIVIESITPPETYLSELNSALSIKPDVRVIVIIEEGKILPEYLASIDKIIKRPANLDFNAASQLATELSSYLKNIIRDVENRLLVEPNRLLKKREPRAALISAFSLLETRLHEKLLNDKIITGEARLSLRKLYELATLKEYENLPSKPKIQQWINTRNNLIHKGESVPTKVAEKMVLEMLQYIKKNYA